MARKTPREILTVRNQEGALGDSAFDLCADVPFVTRRSRLPTVNDPGFPQVSDHPFHPHILRFLDLACLSQYMTPVERLKGQFRRARAHDPRPGFLL